MSASAKTHDQHFQEHGYTILRQIFSDRDLRNYKAVVASIAKKMLAKHCPDFSSEQKTPYDLLKHLEQNSPSAFYTLCTYAGNSLAGGVLRAQPELVAQLEAVDQSSESKLFGTGIALFYNDPSAPRIQYRWHQEAAYFSDLADRVYHVWFPLFRDLSKADGPMVLLSGSHQKFYDFKTEAKTGGVTQMDIDRSITDQFDEVYCDIRRGDAVLFHHNTIHKTSDNTSGVPRISGVMRYVDVMSAPKMENLFTSVAKAHD